MAKRDIAANALMRAVAGPLRLRNYAALVERMMLQMHAAPSNKQLFILGLPRSGTTLVYQYIVHRLNVSYFTNGVGDFPQAPCLITFLQRKRHGNYVSDFASIYGKVQGPTAPREAGAFWGRFFKVDEYTDICDVPEAKRKLLQQTISCIEHIFAGAPFVNKNVKHLLRIVALRRIFPSCYFLIVERDIINTGLSLLRGRYDSAGGPEEWLSARPPDYDTLKDRPVIEQVARQLYSLRAKMNEDVSVLNGHNVMRVNYEEFCDNPEHLIGILDESFGRLGRRNEPIDRFEPTRRSTRTEEEESLVRFMTRIGR